MALQEQTISLSFGQGLDSKTDKKMVVPARLTLLQDGVFTQQNQVRKRNGYDLMTSDIVDGATLSSPTMIRSYKNELICAGTSSATGQRLFSYSDNLGAWVDKGKYLSVAVSKQIISSPGYLTQAETPNAPATLYNSSSATNQSQTLYAWDAGVVLGTGNYGVTFSLFDNDTGSALASYQLITSSNDIVGYSRAALLGSSQLAIFYIATISGVPNLLMKTITYTEANGLVVGPEKTIGPCNTGVTEFPYSYDVLNQGFGSFLAVANETNSNINFYTVNTSGTVLSSGAISTSNHVACVSVTGNGADAWVYWIQNDNTLKYAILVTGTLSVVLTGTSAQTGLSNIQQITALSTSGTTQTVFLSTYTVPATSFTIGIIYPVISQQSNTSAGALGSVTTLIKGVDIHSRPFSMNGRTYMAVVNLSQGQSSGFIIDLADQLPVSKFLQTEAEGVYGSAGDISADTYADPFLVSIRYPGFLNSIYVPPLTSQAILTCGFVVEIGLVEQTSSTAGAAYPVQFAASAQLGVASMTFDFGDINAYQGLTQQDTLVLNGGLVSQYDGSYISELGFSIDPDGLSVIVGNSGGNIGAGTYLYYQVDSWLDLNGNLHQSAPSNPIAVFTSGSSNAVAIGFSGPTLTQKKNVTCNFYRTIADGTIAYLVASIPNQSEWINPNFTDVLSDALIQNYPQMYTQGEAIVPNIAPPPAMVLWTNNNRVWCVDSENPETIIEYCKTASSGTGISFSTGLLEIQIDSRYGAITGASEMDEKTVILKESGVGYFVGDGASDAGTGTTITGFQFVPSDTGCVNSNSVILMPDGVMFKSPKGIYIVTRGVQVLYFGMEVEAYNLQDVRSAVTMPLTSQIRFLTSSGLSLLYDYIFKQWSVFTNHQGLSADVYQGLYYVYARSDGTIFIEDDESYLDNTSSYFLLATTAFIKASSIQNFQRLRRVALLGDYESAAGHGVQIQATYDWGNTVGPVIPYSFDGTTSFFQYRERLPVQKCDSVSFTIQEIVTGNSGEYIDFNDLGIEIGAKQGLRKLPASQSVG